MRLVLLGAPGAGKGTQAVRVARLLKVPHISTGEIFRNNINNKTPIGIRASEFISKGQLVPDDVTCEMVKDRLSKSDCDNGFVLDGFPRTTRQAEFLEDFLKESNIELNAVVDLVIDESKIIKRITGRRVCPSCGENYHIENKKPKVEKICDLCQTELIQRSDDTEETVKNRMKTYFLETEPLIDFYKNKGLLIEINGDADIDEVSINVIKSLGVTL